MSEALAPMDGHVDVWVLRHDAAHPDPAAGLVGTFRIDRGMAETLLRTLPRAVKRGTTVEKAETMRVALEALGFEVELRRASRPMPSPPLDTSRPERSPADPQAPRTSGAHRRFPKPALGPGNLPSIPPAPRASSRAFVEAPLAKKRVDDTTLILALQREERGEKRPRDRSRPRADARLVAVGVGVVVVVVAIALVLST